MSYARKGPESDVYVYRATLLDDTEGSVLICHHCGLSGAQVDDDGHYVTRGTAASAAMLEHLQAHREMGGDVPDAALERLRGEAAKELAHPSAQYPS